ncbi:type II toxin-antitoxin system VapC family toxin, partial [Streptomyces sp. NPDC059506]|uniref:type II toxin-antitoxin system VapC family toxin n=1 Tax=Streptomyces TaxID=1883 RepID=UPI000CBA96E6|nr:type II toxin-antitoxin system VapC family toxin [Streptomyces sp. SCUT-3]PLW65321.1 VapC toxin family PIN domain ribonuclease [Streptomyces sp. DJ]QMV23644.1 PIN domain-containing protein [Streptomyces sp. SCUT-3]
MIYLDTCALLKLAHREAESSALRAWLLSSPTENRRVSSALAEVEAARALRRSDPEALPRLPGLLAAFDLIEIDQAVRRRAAAYPDPLLRSLDAIHLATAEEVRPELSAFVTYDKRLASAAMGIGLPVVAPS